MPEGSISAKLALDMIAATARLQPKLPVPFSIRVGLHSGPAMAGVIGTRKFAYDVWGDTVNIAARIEAASQPNRVLISAATAKMLGGDFKMDGPHKIDNKEQRELEGFFVSLFRVFSDRSQGDDRQWKQAFRDLTVSNHRCN